MEYLFFLFTWCTKLHLSIEKNILIIFTVFFYFFVEANKQRASCS